MQENGDISNFLIINLLPHTHFIHGDKIEKELHNYIKTYINVEFK